VLALLATAELTLGLGGGRGYAAVHDTYAVASTRISLRRSVADPFILGRATLMKCDPSGIAECHRGRSLLAGLRFHPESADWLGVELSAGLGQISAIRPGPRPDRYEPPPPHPGDVVTVIGAGIDLRMPLSKSFYARFDLALNSWPSLPFKALVELTMAAGLGVSL
jgi:hypothetical protein